MAYAPKRQVCIYLVAEEGSLDVAKIGITELLSRRLCSIQSHNWRKLSIPYAFAVPTVDQARDIEQIILDVFAAERIRGEWIRVSPARLAQEVEAHLRVLEIPILDLIKSGADANVIAIGRRA